MTLTLQVCIFRLCAPYTNLFYYIDNVYTCLRTDTLGDLFVYIFIPQNYSHEYIYTLHELSPYKLMFRLVAHIIHAFELHYRLAILQRVESIENDQLITA